jgi:Tfp pilus assembly protein PilN
MLSKIQLPTIRWPIRRRSHSGAGGGAAGKPIVVCFWNRSEIRYLAVQTRGTGLHCAAAGSIERQDAAGDGDKSPIPQLLEHLADKLPTQWPRNLVVLLTRAELEQLQLPLPPAEADEQVILVRAAIEEQLSDSESLPAIDFVLAVSPDRAAEGGPEAIAFCLPQERLDAWTAQARDAKWRLQNVGSRHLAPLGMLKRRELFQRGSVITIVPYGQEIELLLCRDGQPMFLRNLRVSSEEPESVAELVTLEIQRWLALANMDDDPTGPEIFILAGREEQQGLLEALKQRRVGSLHCLDPASQLTFSDAASAIDTRIDAPLLGAALELQHDGRLPIDLMHPRQPPTVANPWIRRGALAGLVALAVGTAGGLLWRDVQTLKTEATLLQDKLDSEQQLTDKLAAQADEVDRIEAWLSDQVDWLAQLQKLSDGVPTGQFATIGQLRAAAAGGRGSFDLSVQVSSPDQITQLEESLRSARFSVTSSRVTEQASGREYPWQFETRAVFSIDPEQSVIRYQPPPADAASEPPPSPQPSPQPSTGRAPSEDGSPAAGGRPSAEEEPS